MKKDLQSDSKDLQITLYSVIYISGFICVGSFYRFQLYVFATNLVFCAHGLRENKWKLRSPQRPLEGISQSPNISVSLRVCL